MRHRADGTPYVWLYLGKSPITGKQVRKYRSFPNMTDAEALEAATALYRSLKGARTTGDALALYVEGMRAQGRSYNTIKTYRLYATSYAAPIAGMLVSEVTPSMLEELFLELMTNGPKGRDPLSTSTVKKFREFLKGAFRHFVRLGHIEKSPIDGTMPIPAQKYSAVSLTDAELRAFLGAISQTLADHPDTKRGIMRRNAAFGMLLLLNTGARVGEVCAIRRQEIVPAGIRINGTIAERSGKAIRQGQTKGHKPRIVSIDADTAEALRRHLRWQSEYLATVGDTTPICTLDGHHMKPSTLSNQFRRYRDALGINRLATLHSLRHTHATLLISRGEDFRTVQERLGHAQPSTTMDTYAHVVAGRDQQAADGFGMLLNELGWSANSVQTAQGGEAT